MRRSGYKQWALALAVCQLVLAGPCLGLHRHGSSAGPAPAWAGARWASAGQGDCALCAWQALAQQQPPGAVRSPSASSSPEPVTARVTPCLAPGPQVRLAARDPPPA